MLKFSTFRDKRYLRTRFMEGKYLMASEGSDLQLENLDLYRTFIEEHLGNVAIADSWKVERLSDSELLINQGSAWYKGLPFKIRDYKDSQITIGTLDPSVTATLTDYYTTTKQGKKLTFSSALAYTYSIVISAEEQIVTAVAGEDPFLQNYNITETTAQKVNILYKVNVVKTSEQLESPQPYATYGGKNNRNLLNYIKVVPTVGVSDLVSSVEVTDISQKKLDGRNYIVTVNNTQEHIPLSTTQRDEFVGGYLVDSKGSRYYLINIQISSDNLKAILYIDAEDKEKQDAPEIGTYSYYLYKNDIFHSTSSGTPQGTLYWSIATVSINSSFDIAHSSSVVDLRDKIVTVAEYQEMSNTKFGIMATQGGDFSWQVGAANVDVLSWSDIVVLISGDKKQQTIASGSAAVIDGGCIAYEMDLSTAGTISLGNLSVTVASGTTTLTLSGSPDLSTVRKGNIIRLNASPYTVSTITAIDDVADTVTITPAFGTTGSATIYRDSFAPEYVPTTEDTFILACRKSTKLYLSPGTELDAGEVNRLGDGVPNGLLTFIGSTGENDNSPTYPYTFYIANGDPLNFAIGKLDNEINDIYDILATPVYDERTLYPAGLASGTNIHIPVNSRDGAVQKTFTAESGELLIFVNQITKFQGTDSGGASPADWYATDSGGTYQATGVVEYIKFNFDLPVDAEVHYRIDTLGGSGAGGGGGSSLQDAYLAGSTITTSVGVPFTVAGTAAEVADFQGNIIVTGLIL